MCLYIYIDREVTCGLNYNTSTTELGHAEPIFFIRHVHLDKRQHFFGEFVL